MPFIFLVAHFALISLASYLRTLADFGIGMSLAFTAPDAWPTGCEPDLLRVYILWVIVLNVTCSPGVDSICP